MNSESWQEPLQTMFLTLRFGVCFTSNPANRGGQFCYTEVSKYMTWGSIMPESRGKLAIPHCCWTLQSDSHVPLPKSPTHSTAGHWVVECYAHYSLGLCAAVLAACSKYRTIYSRRGLQIRFLNPPYTYQMRVSGKDLWERPQGSVLLTDTSGYSDAGVFLWPYFEKHCSRRQSWFQLDTNRRRLSR